MELAVLATGSSGNATLVRSGGTLILVDAGISALQIRRRLEIFGIAEEELSAVIISHEHSDHVRGLEVMLKRRALPVWTTAGTWSRLAVRCRAGGELISGRGLRLGGIDVLPVATSHDAAEPVALVFDDGRHRAGLCTDTGVLTALLRERLCGCDLLLLEANHDADMLRHGPYPWPLKQRISSRLGHLGNHQSQEGLAELCDGSTRAVVGMHLSAENNLPELARESLAAGVGAGVVVDAVTRSEMLGLSMRGSTPCLVKHPVPPPRPRVPRG